MFTVVINAIVVNRRGTFHRRIRLLIKNKCVIFRRTETVFAHDYLLRYPVLFDENTNMVWISRLAGFSVDNKKKEKTLIVFYHQSVRSCRSVDEAGPAGRSGPAAGGGGC